MSNDDRLRCPAVHSTLGQCIRDRDHEGYPHYNVDGYEWVERRRPRSEVLSPSSPLEAQVQEALSILESGTDYEKLHVIAILQNGLEVAKAQRENGR